MEPGVLHAVPMIVDILEARHPLVIDPVRHVQATARVHAVIHVIIHAMTHVTINVIEYVLICV